MEAIAETESDGYADFKIENLEEEKVCWSNNYCYVNKLHIINSTVQVQLTHATSDILNKISDKTSGYFMWLKVWTFLYDNKQVVYKRFSV